MNKFYVTTPIFYVNDAPHVGHFYCTTAADALARFHRLRLGQLPPQLKGVGLSSAESVFFATGTDEHGQKAEKAAKEKNLEPQPYVDDMSNVWKTLWENLNMSFDKFIRTTDARHEKVSRHLFKLMRDKGDIYKGMYTGWYCVSCESFWLPQDLAEGKCPNEWCKREVSQVSEETYFFRLSAYQEKLLEHYESHPQFVKPETRFNEVKSFVKSGLQDISISRTNFKWGISVPDDPQHVMYVWFEALMNYLTVVDFPVPPQKDDALFKKFWPANVHLVGKDIIRFHAVIWPAMLMSAGLALPECVFAHGFWMVEGEKMSKSKGNFIAPQALMEELIKKLGITHEIANDVVRYYLLRDAPFGEDGNFSMRGLLTRFNADCANDLGNLLHRTLPVIERNCDGNIPDKSVTNDADKKFCAALEALASEYEQHMLNIEPHLALAKTFQCAAVCNKYIDEHAPWNLQKQNDPRFHTVVHNLCDAIRLISVMVYPFMPHAADSLWKQLGIPEKIETAKWNEQKKTGKLNAGLSVKREKPLFPRVDIEKTLAGETEAKPTAVKEKKAAGKSSKDIPPADEVDIADFKKLDLRVAEVLSCKKVEGTQNLFQLTVDMGTEQRTLISGIAKWYKEEELVGKRVIVIANLKPAKIRGVESRGMVLAADSGEILGLLTVDKDVSKGAKVS